jgi:hypothetical protein
MADEKRKCTFSMHGEKEEGTFVQFAPIETYDESNQLHTPVKAIVERDNGQVIILNPNSITFVK